MTKNYDNIRIYGDDASAWYIADKGTTAPVDLAAPGAGWKDAGWLEESGVEYNQDSKSKQFKAHQGGAIVKQKVTEVNRTFKLGCLEETALTLGLVHPGATMTKSVAGVVKIAVPAGMPAVDKAFIIDEVDGAYKKRWLIPAGQAVLSDAVAHNVEDLTAYMFELTVFGAMDIETNSPGVVAGVTT